MPAADTVLRGDDELIVIGPTEAIARLEKGVPPADEAAAHAEID
jgi:Trk K+ transport system NAD-binding subunit